MPLALVRGDQLDQDAMTVEQAYVGDVTALARLERALSRADGDRRDRRGRQGGPIKLGGVRYDMQTGARSELIPITVPDASQLADAAKKIHAKLDEDWRGLATVRRDQQAGLDVVVPIRALADWVQVRQRLGGIPAIKTRGGAHARSRPRRAASRLLRLAEQLQKTAVSGRAAAREGCRQVAAAGAVSNRWRFWLGVAAGFLLLLWLLNDILLPFVVGAAVAYFFDPVVMRLQRAGLSRTWATAVVTIIAVLIAAGAAMAVVPPLFGQVQALIGKAPEYVVKAAQRVQPMIEPVREKMGLPPLSLQELQADATQTGRAGARRAWAASPASVAQRGVAIINLLGLLFLTPVVTFYLLRDWPKVMAAINGALPLDHADTIRALAHESNAAVAGYLRGQALVCLCLGTLYGVGLSLVGLQFGFVIGLIAGLISFIPFVGTLVGATLSIGMALAQFPPDWFGVAKVAAVFLVGHLLEGNCAVAQAGRRPGRPASGLDHVRAAGRRLAVRLRRRADRGAGRGGDRRGGAPSAGPLPRKQLLSRRRVRLTMVKQLTLDLALPPPTFAREDFVSSDGNREALAWIDRWPDWPAPALALSGPPGSGKTHLARIWAARAQAAVLDARRPRGQERPDLTALSRGACRDPGRPCRPRARTRAVPSLQSDARAARPSAAGRRAAAGALAHRAARSRLATARRAGGRRGAARRRAAGLDHPETARRPAIACRPRRRAVSRLAHGALGRGGPPGRRRARPARAQPNGARSTGDWRPTCWRNSREERHETIARAGFAGAVRRRRHRRSSRA